MILRNTLLVLGVLAVLTGAVLSVLASGPMLLRARPADPVSLGPEILVAARAIETGTLLRLGDMMWQPVAPGTAFLGSLRRGETGADAFVGAVARRDFAAGEPLFAVSLIRPGDRGFLAAVLAPGSRAVSVSVDAPQSAAGLMLPGDHVDVILTQNFRDAGADPAHRSVGETILADRRIIAVDQRVSPSVPPTPPDQRGLPADAQFPRTITLEVTADQAQALFVATQMGRIELALRSLANAPQSAPGRWSGQPAPTWAADVSPALLGLAARAPPPLPPEQPSAEPERPKMEVMHGARTELR
ncbi:MAG: Flp pilus assembly protein CpaB [Acetobacteraceae bacterium]